MVEEHFGTFLGSYNAAPQSGKGVGLGALILGHGKAYRLFGRSLAVKCTVNNHFDGGMAGAYTFGIEYYRYASLNSERLALGHYQVVTFNLDNRVLGPYTLTVSPCSTTSPEGGVG